MTGLAVPLAHLGHWYVGIPVYCGPVVALILWVKIGNWREDKKKKAEKKQTRT